MRLDKGQVISSNPMNRSKPASLAAVRGELELPLERVLLALLQPLRRRRLEVLREQVLQVALHLGPRRQPDLNEEG